METQRVHHPSAAEAKPLATTPTFPLAPLELQRWVRFALKGGIGKAVAKVDKVSEDGVRDLMFLAGDEVRVLMDLGQGRYLVRSSLASLLSRFAERLVFQGYCEGVVGLFSGEEVVMQQPKLKRPVISTRSSAPASRASPLPPVDYEKGALSPLHTAQSPDILSPAPSTSKLAISRSGSLPSVSSLSSPISPGQQRRKPVPTLGDLLHEASGTGPEKVDLRSRRKGDVAGLGIAVGGGRARSPPALAPQVLLEDEQGA